MANIAIIGAGPAGLMAAETLASAGYQVAIYDQMPTPGRKFLMAGLGGLNISHAGKLDDVLASYFHLPETVQHSIEAFPPQAVTAWVEALGEPTFVGSNGKIFPKSFKASPLLRAWLRRLQSMGVELHSRHRWTGFDENGDLLFQTPDAEALKVSCDAMIMALGGASWPRLGSDGLWAKIWHEGNAGLPDLVPFQPSNMGVNISWSEHIKAGFAGQPLKAITVTLADKIMPGEVVVTKYGLEGPAIYALSAALRRQLTNGPLQIMLDLRPALSREDIQKRLEKVPTKLSLSNRLRRALKLTAVERVLLRELRDFSGNSAILAGLIKALPLTVTGHQGLERAISSSGGVDAGTLDEHLMLKAKPGVFIAGEMLDFDAPTGGYLLQAALSTGRLAGEGAIKFLTQAGHQPTSKPTLQTQDHTMSDNPLLAPWTTLFKVPPFAAVLPEHFSPGFESAMQENRAEIDEIADNAAAPDFENTIVALEKSGDSLDKVASTFFNLSGADTNDDLQQIERDIAPKLSRHSSATVMNEKLFKRIDTVFQQRDDLKLTSEELRVLEKYHENFVRAGAALKGADRERMAEISARLAELGTQFAQNVLADERNFQLVLENEQDLEGLPDFLISAAQSAAEERGQSGKHVITLSRSLIEPFLQFSSRRDLREAAFKGWIARGENGGDSDNLAIISETLTLRQERANLLGFEDFAHFKLANQMAKTPDAVRDLLENVWAPARQRAAEESTKLSALAQELGDNAQIAPWDWRYYSDKVRMRDHALDEAEIKPYFQLDKMIEAAFATANKLFGVWFREVTDLELYHPDVRAWEVRDNVGNHIGLFLGDYFARPSKRSGAWMSAFRSQEKLSGNIRPIIVNVMNFAKAPKGQPALLTFDDAHTLFHEFGHGLHGLLSDVTYPLVSGTSVARDFVELPSQLFEHWLTTPEILSTYAIHAKTGEAIPKDLMERLLAASTFNQGFATVEYTSCALVDLEMHLNAKAAAADPVAFERAALEKIGMPSEIVMRHRTPHFMHVFSGDGYSSGYYSYLWSEVMDADAFVAFEETGNPFDEELAKKLKTNIYSAGNSKDPAELYTAFRGRMPSIDALLRKRGLQSTA
ncbi:MAG: hypothetical protein COA52_16115 [Hyphomicrobiales bacterium]|nr:MAG: hypothetical protein COA52_16115 [Hyphomicrobiales bacterium]